ncbi:MAG: hypothetical protein H6534_00005 [Chthonomonadaceae bacterium]|nr:hypothetical protein [Chthonomonadaceae bacterium]
MPPRPAKTAPPQGLAEGIDLQDDLANLWREPDGAELRPDPLASDGIACWMPGSHLEWAFQIPSSRGKGVEGARYRVFVVVRLETEGSDASPGFSAGVYDTDARKELHSHVFPIDQTSPGYRAYELGTVVWSPTLTVWVAPPANGRVHAVWVDRVYLVPESGL